MCGSPNSLHACESINSVLRSLSWLWLFPCWQGLCCKQILNSFGVHKQFPPVSHFQFLHLKTRATVFAETTSWVGISNLRLLSRAWFLETWTFSIFCVLRTPPKLVVTELKRLLMPIWYLYSSLELHAKKDSLYIEGMTAFLCRLSLEIHASRSKIHLLKSL